MGRDDFHLSGFLLHHCEPESPTEKVLRFLQPLHSEQEFDYDEPQWYCREQLAQETERYKEDSSSPPPFHGGEEWDAVNATPTRNSTPWDDIEDAASAIYTPSPHHCRVTTPIPLKTPSRLHQAKEYAYAKRTFFRDRGQFSSSKKPFLPLSRSNDHGFQESGFRSPKNHDPQEPKSPVAPVDVRFSWDFSESSEPPFSVEPVIGVPRSKHRDRRLPLTEPLPVVLAKFPSKASEVDVLDSNLIISRKMRASSRSVVSSTNFLSQSLQSSLEFVSDEKDFSCETSQSAQKIPKLLMPVSSLSASYASSIGPLPQSFGTTKCFQRFMSDAERRKFNVQNAHLSMHTERGRKSVINALIHQLIKARDSSLAKTVAERVMLLLTSAMSHVPHLVSDSSGPGLNLLTAKGLLVEREVELFITLDNITALFPKNDRDSKPPSSMPLLAACVGNGPSSIGLGLILFFGWFNPSIEVHVDGFGPSLDWDEVSESINFPGVGMYECKGLNKLIQSKDCLQEYEVVVLSHVLVEFMQGKKANDWASFWKKLHEGTRNDVFVVIIDCLRNQKDFMHPHSVMNTNWECVLLGKQQSDILQPRSRLKTQQQFDKLQYTSNRSQDDTQKIFRMFIAWKVG